MRQITQEQLQTIMESNQKLIQDCPRQNLITILDFLNEYATKKIIEDYRKEYVALIKPILGERANIWQKEYKEQLEKHNKKSWLNQELYALTESAKKINLPNALDFGNSVLYTALDEICRNNPDMPILLNNASAGAKIEYGWVLRINKVYFLVNSPVKILPLLGDEEAENQATGEKLKLEKTINDENIIVETPGTCFINTRKLVPIERENLVANLEKLKTVAKENNVKLSGTKKIEEDIKEFYPEYQRDVEIWNETYEKLKHQAEEIEIYQGYGNENNKSYKAVKELLATDRNLAELRGFQSTINKVEQIESRLKKSIKEIAFNKGYIKEIKL